MRKLYRKIAKANGTSVAKVKYEMQRAINWAYMRKSNDGVTAAYQSRVPRKDEIPTVEEFINYTAGIAKKRP